MSEPVDWNARTIAEFRARALPSTHAKLQASAPFLCSNLGAHSRLSVNTSHPTSGRLTQSRATGASRAAVR